MYLAAVPCAMIGYKVNMALTRTENNHTVGPLSDSLLLMRVGDYRERIRSRLSHLIAK